MSHSNVKRTGAIALLVICVAGASAIATISLEHYFIRPLIEIETRTIKRSSIPFNSSVYLSSDVGSCRGPGGHAPCFVGDFSQAELFNCAGTAATPSGCTRSVVSSSNPQNSYQITIWYPYVGRSNEASWVNCIYTTSGDPGQRYGAYCVSLSLTEFIVTEPAPPPL